MAAVVNAIWRLETPEEKKAALARLVDNLSVSEVHHLKGLVDRRQMQTDIVAKLEQGVRTRMCKHLSVRDMVVCRQVSFPYLKHILRCEDDWLMILVGVQSVAEDLL